MTAILVESALRGLLFAAIVGLGLAAFRVRNVPARKAAWTVVLIASLAMPMLMRLPGSLRIPVEATWLVPVRMTTTPAVQSLPAVTESSMAPRVSPRTGVSVDLAPVDSDPVAGVVPAPLPRAATTHTAMHWPPVRQVLAWAYLAVTAVLLLRLLLGVAAAIRLWATAELVSPLIAPEPNVRASSRIAAPVTVGSGIVLPADYPQWDRAKLRMVIAHERSHVRQLDFYLQLLAGLYTALFWFSPLGWWLRHTLCSLGEAIGDRAGMQAATTRSRYAETLLEIAALPHRGLPGVAMARSANLSRRVDSMLNDRQLRSAFVEGRIRAAASLLVIPAALLLALAVIRPPAAAAQSAQQAAPPPASDAVGQKPVTGQSNPPEDQVGAPKPSPAEPQAPSVPPAAVKPQAGAVPSAPATPEAEPQTAPAPPETSEDAGQSEHSTRNANHYGYMYHYGWDGDSYAIVTGDGQHITMTSDGNEMAELEKARHAVNGPFLWFRHEGKSYVVTDPAILADLEKKYAPMQELGKQQAELGRQQSALGRQQEELGQRQSEAGAVRMPDLSKEMADVNVALARMKDDQTHWNAQKWADLEAKLKADQDKMLTPEKMAEIQGKLAAFEAEWNSERMTEFQARMAELQAKLGSIQGEAGSRMGAFGSQMGELGHQMGELGRQQGELGQQQGRIAEEVNREVQRIIRESLANGTAKPVQ